MACRVRDDLTAGVSTLRIAKIAKGENVITDILMKIYKEFDLTSIKLWI